MAQPPKITNESFTQLFTAFDIYLKRKGSPHADLQTRVGGIFDTLEKIADTLDQSSKNINFDKFSKNLDNIIDKTDKYLKPLEDMFKDYTEKMKKSFDRMLTTIDLKENLTNVFEDIGTDFGDFKLANLKHPFENSNTKSTMNNKTDLLLQELLEKFSNKEDKEKPESALSQKGLVVDSFGEDARKYLQAIGIQSAKRPDNIAHPSSSGSSKSGGVFGFLSSLLGLGMVGIGSMGIIGGLLGPNNSAGALKFIGRMFIHVRKNIGTVVKTLFTGLIGLPKNIFKMGKVLFGGNLITSVKNSVVGMWDVFKAGGGFFGKIGGFFSALKLEKGFFNKLKLIFKGGAKGLKRIPILGSLIGIAFAYKRIKDGDYVGGTLDILSTIANLFPGVGTVVSLAIDGLSMLYDLQTGGSENAGNLSLSQQAGKLGDAIWSGVSTLFEYINKAVKWFWEFLSEKFGEAGKWLKDQIIRQAPGLAKALGIVSLQDAENISEKRALEEKQKNNNGIKNENIRSIVQKQTEDIYGKVNEDGTFSQSFFKKAFLLSKYGRSQTAADNFRQSYDSKGWWDQFTSFQTRQDKRMADINQEKADENFNKVGRFFQGTDMRNLMSKLYNRDPETFDESFSDLIDNMKIRIDHLNNDRLTPDEYRKESQSIKDLFKIELDKAANVSLDVQTMDKNIVASLEKMGARLDTIIKTTAATADAASAGAVVAASNKPQRSANNTQISLPQTSFGRNRNMMGYA